MKPIGSIILVLGLIFVAVGDTFLPKPLSTASKNARTYVNNIFLSFTPDTDFEKPSKQREAQVDDLEERVKGNRDRLVEQP
ncbi:hypothetical protein WH8501_05560 [Crocosphaera watsonii WH 8501]|uniref:Uncharacterized protein n=3 Tax=Crocosphaera watsonii TaxID=263511 RepID=Q4BXN0_CROWT|nr:MULTISPECIES: hypothetical protein [Crocosphaera]EAM48651.1 hypothetical protein CwatDRAFT_1578 [Crocosphaera watsonii WH 8501]MCH2243041.1 hypothetical protein [Crocosphaera sp.]NQZ62641.1 hypothetical protein [Crocosphaera sp.]CCQ57545.1 hypothetical protein CWATWH0005_3075 [Crocosphaera watsonii WH 0005]CCQ69285.1 hypothetical protein CWATWH0402_2032 [Crocosphaera watsonii WH 0402]